LRVNRDLKWNLHYENYVDTGFRGSRRNGISQRVGCQSEL
jgi:hypothetical protein